MAKVSRGLLERTIEVWQSHSEEDLTIEDAREIVGSITEFFSLLRAWRTAAEVTGPRTLGDEGVGERDGAEKRNQWSKM